MQRALMLLIAAVVITWAAGAATRDNSNLRGAYAFTGTLACLWSSGFSNSLQPLDDSTAFTNSVAQEGIRIFKGDGTGTVKATGVGFSLPPGSAAFANNQSYSFTYTVKNDGSFSVDVVPNTFIATLVAGPQTGQTFTISNFPTLTGLMGAGQQTLTLAGLTPTVETVTYSDGSVFQRICHRSQVLTKLQGSEGND